MSQSYYNYFDRYIIIDMEINNDDELLKNHYKELAIKHNEKTLSDSVKDEYTFPVLCASDLIINSLDNGVLLVPFDLKIKLTSTFYSKCTQNPNKGYVLNSLSQINTNDIQRCGNALVQGNCFSAKNNISLNKYEPFYYLKMFYPTIVKIL